MCPLYHLYEARFSNLARINRGLVLGGTRVGQNTLIRIVTMWLWSDMRASTYRMLLLEIYLFEIYYWNVCVCIYVYVMFLEKKIKRSFFLCFFVSFYFVETSSRKNLLIVFDLSKYRRISYSGEFVLKREKWSCRSLKYYNFR